MLAANSKKLKVTTTKVNEDGKRLCQSLRSYLGIHTPDGQTSLLATRRPTASIAIVASLKDWWTWPQKHTGLSCGLWQKSGGTASRADGQVFFQLS